ncbi:glycoside hydrolase family 25 protein [Nocardia stercoris]|uniref:Lysozyme n=1 Tax=Nocardia stercoris TaxID=2483361 RepID=A0A3M2L454_9NOCA|nr:GH25 family lysozyme [Nocardia stercoris]RMI31283.1 hypothetical protein EBN03_18115 [Nocardia stercoris]
MTLYGIDISNNNGSGIDLAEVRAEGFDFVFCKVSEGVDFVDATWPGYRDAAQAAGLLLAGYHYLRSGSSVEAQADTFVSNLGPGIAAMVDFEAGSGGLDTFWAFVNAVDARGTRVALSYIPHWYWQQIGGGDLSAVPGLIQSAYVGGSGYASELYPGDDAAGWRPFGGRTPDLLQFTDSAIVAGHSVDADAFRGTRDQLAALLTGPQGVFMALDDAQQAELLAQVGDIDTQLRGPGNAGWPQLGVDAAGQNLTLVDAVAAMRADLATLAAEIAAIKAKLTA